MSRNPTFTVNAAIQVIHGRKRLVFDSLARYQRVIDALHCDRVTVTIQKEIKRRSLKQNAFHWAVCVPMIAAELGYEREEYDEVHYALVSKCFGVTKDERSGLEVPNKRSSKLSTEEFKELIEWEQRWAAKELGIVIPDPDPEWMFDAV